MNDQTLSKRLNAAAEFVPAGARLADIGSDHAYLPCDLVEKKKIKFALAGEVASGPYERSKAEVQKRKLETFIQTRKGDGLAIIKPEDRIDTVSICGMGGLLITDILSQGKKEGKLHSVEWLVLQPNVGQASVREWLDHNQFIILDEKIVYENKKYYEIIFAKLDKQKKTAIYSLEDYTFGVKLRKECHPLFVKKWQLEKAKFEQILERLKESENKENAQQKKILEKIKEIEEMISTCRES